MSVPYTAGFTTRLLRAMPAERLAVVTYQDFQRWPAPKPLPGEIGRELIKAERARRAGAAGQSS